MTWKFFLLVSVVLTSLGFGMQVLRPVTSDQASTRAAPASASQRQVEHPPTIQTSVEEVLLDVIVRDRHGKMVHNLTPDQIQVFEDGNPQPIRSFRLVEGSAVLGGQEASTPVGEPLGGLNLVTLVFERLDQESARLARQAALDFLNTEKSLRVFMAVFTIDQRLYVVQPFTNNHELLRKAIEQATRSSSAQLAAQSDAIQGELESAAGALNAANQSLTSAILSGGPGSRAAKSAMAQAIFARMTADMLVADEALTREQEGRTSFYSLISLVKNQRQLSGRKTILYVTRGLQLTRGVRELLHATVSEANRANVSFYAVDARGLSTSIVTA